MFAILGSVAAAHALCQLGWILGIAVTGAVLAGVVIPVAVHILSTLLELTPRLTHPISPPIWLTGYVTGAVEIVVFSTAVALDISGVMVAMIAWNAIKGQMHWQIFTKSGDISRSYVAVLGGLLSIFLRC
jgi:hypothetical protein